MTKKKGGAATNKTAVLTDYSQEVAGYKIRPWSLTQIAALASVFDGVRKVFSDNGITLQSALAALDGKDPDMMMRILGVIPSELLTIVCFTLSIKPEEFAKKSSDEQFLVAHTIIAFNFAYLKNWLSPFKEMVKAAAT